MMRSSTVLIASLVIMLGSTAPARAQSKPSGSASGSYGGGQVPYGYHVESKPSYTLVITGAAAALVGVTALIATSVAEKHAECHKDESCTTHAAVSMAALGVLISGVVVSCIGFVVRSNVVVPNAPYVAAQARPARQWIGVGGQGSGIGLTAGAEF